MTTVKSNYQQGLRTSSEHLKSGNKILTDAPVDNNGKGETFSPTDLVASALGSCMMTVMGIAGEKKGIDLSGMHMETTKVMTSKPPRKIARIEIEFFWNNCPLDDAEKEWIKNIGLNCPVALSLHPDLVQQVNFHF